MDEDDSNVKLNNYEAEKSTISFPLSPELSTKKRRRKKRPSVTQQESNSNLTSEINSRVSQENSGIERSSNSSGISQESHDGRESCTSRRNILVASKASPNARLPSTDIHCSKLIDNHDKKLASELPCSSNSTISKVNCRKGQEDILYSETSPILKSNSHKKLSRQFKKKILNDKDVCDRFEVPSDAAPLESIHLHKIDDKIHDSSDSNMLPIEDNDISFSVIEEICQTTELTFNCDRACNKNSFNNDSSRSKSSSALCGKSSSNLENESKNTSCDKLVNFSNKLIDNNNCVNKTDIEIVVRKRKETNSRCGSIYVNNSRKNDEPTINSGSIKTLLESTKLLDDAESVSYLKETKKQKEFKLMCSKEKLNDGSYVCFENISKTNRMIDNDSRGTSKISVRYENEVSCDRSSLMEKYNIDMNNTLNISSDQLDDLISNAEDSVCDKKTNYGNTSSIENNSECLNEFYEQQILGIKKSSVHETFAGISKCSTNKTCEKGSFNSSINVDEFNRDAVFQEPKSKKSVSFKKLTSNPTHILKLSKGRTNCESSPKNGQIPPKISKENDKKNYAKQSSEFSSTTIDRKTFNCENLDILTRKINCDTLDDSVTKIIAPKNGKFMPTSGEYNLENESCDAALRGFSTASGKSISVSEEALAKAKSVFSENETCDAAFSGFSTANGKFISVSEEALSKARTLLSETEPCDEGFSGSSTTNRRITVFEDALVKVKTMPSEKELNNLRIGGFSTARSQSITVPGEALPKSKALLSEKENDYLEFNEFSTARGKTISISEATLTKERAILAEKVTCDTAFSGFSTAKGKLISVSEEALVKARAILAEKEPCNTAFNEFSTSKRKSIPSSKEALIEARALLTEKEYCDTAFSGFLTAKGKSISVSEEALVKARTLLSEKEPDNIKFNVLSSAKGKSMQVSEEALANARTLLSEKESFDTAFSGFSTAKGKSISVSEEALAKARTLLSEKESYDTAFSGFSTVKGESIQVSEEALAKARTLTEKESFDTAFGGFSTAKGKPISVSGEALAKARTLLSEKESCDSTFSGFSTAQGKSISVSEKALAKARTLLSEKESCGMSSSGFLTAKGKSIQVSEEALSKARTLLSEKELYDISSSGFSTAEKEKESCGMPFGGFSTAKGKSIQVSEEALAKARTLLTEKESCATAFSGFSTAKGKSISVSEEALAKARTLLSEKESCDTSNTGFSTAKGKSIRVSEEALSKARTLLSEKESSDISSSGFSTAEKEKESCDTSFGGFSTAKGKLIQVSEEALAKARTLLTEKESCNTAFSGFSTAKGKSISVSEEALAKSRTLLSEKESCDMSFGGFLTAKGKSIKVSEEALAKARTLLTEKESCATAFSGFLTAKGKSISVSEEALTKARTLLSEKESEDLKLSGFPTAEGKSIQVSEEALAKAREIPSEKELSNEASSGFSTAKGKSILVSEEALSNARSIFSEKESKNLKLGGFSSAILVSDEALAQAKNELPDKSSVSSEKSKAIKASVSKSTILVGSSSNCKTFSQQQKSSSYQISNLNKDEFVRNFHDSKLENDCSVIEEEPCLQDSYIDHQNFKSQLTPKKNTNSSNLQSQFYEDMPCLSLSFVDEVSESTAAFLADEDISELHNRPAWLRTFVTSPSMIQDRSDALSPILCSDSNVKMGKKRACSPILGQGDRFKKRKKRLTFSKRKLHQEAECSTPVSHSKVTKNPEDQYNSFIGNLRTSTPISINRTKSKRVIQTDEQNCASEKKLKLMDSWDDSQVDQSIFYQLDVIEGRRKAAEKQELLLKNCKDKSLTKMRKGTLFLKKQMETRISLKSLVNPPRQMLSSSKLIKKGIRQSVLGVTHKNAAEFRFSSLNSLSNEICESNCDGVSVGDDALVVLSDDGSAGLKEISRAFLASPGVDPALISEEWIANHYRSIVWKLAATERSFPHLFAGIYLTLDNVLLQLKYRYDREIDDCQRSCLRKILETDESAARRMVLCVSEISAKQSSATKDVRLTDGWYGISASLDEEMTCLIDKGRVAVGTKLVVQGCELLNCEQGHDPLKVPNKVQLKVHTNSARRAKWDSRLGFCQIQGSILVRLKDILPKGGNIGQVDALVVRVYPLVYLFKTECGKTVVYSRKREEQECLLNERKMTELMEKLQSQVQKEMDEIDNMKSNTKLKRSITNQYDEPLSVQDVVDSDQIPTKDQMRIISNLREQKQSKYQETLRQKLDEKMSENGEVKRTSIPMLKVRITDARQSNEDMNMTLNTAMLTVWKPTEDVENVLVEGNIISLYNITAQGKRSGELQLSTGRQTKYSIISKSESFSRACHFLCDISHSLNPLFSEINTVGLIVHVESSSTSVETAYLTDRDCNFLGIRFWGGIKKYGWQSCVCVGSEISCINLEWRPNAFKCNVPYVFVTELSVFSSNPRSKYLQKALDQLKVSLKGMDLNEFISTSKEKLLDILNGGEPGGSKWNPSTKDCSPSACSETNNPNRCAITPSNKNLITENPMSSVKSKVLLEKMQRLHGYGSAPTITAMPNLQVSPALKKDFKMPNRQSL